MKNKSGTFILSIVTNKDFTYCVYLLILVSGLCVLAFNLPKYEANNNKNYKEENAIEKNAIEENEENEENPIEENIMENGSYRKYDYDAGELQFIIVNNGKDKLKVADVSCIYEKIGQPEKLCVEISSDDIP